MGQHGPGRPGRRDGHSQDEATGFGADAHDGKLSLTKSLLREGLVDYLQITLFPVITAQSGKEPLFAGVPDLDLELVESRTFDGRSQLLRYVPTLH